MKNSIEIVDNFILDDKLRTNRIKLVETDSFIQVYVDSGTERITGFRKRANIRLDAKRIKELKEWVNGLELKE